MNLLRQKFFLLFIASATLFSCNSSTETKEQPAADTLVAAKDSIVTETMPEPAPVVVPDTIPAPPYSEYDHIAAYLAGMLPDTLGSPLAAISQHREWLAYSSRSDAGWKRMQQLRLDSMSKWSDSQMNSLKKTSNNSVFYPFSGPDFLHAHTFFPKAKNYFMIGLEPVGEKPALEKLQQDSAYRYLQQTSKALMNIMRGGYFITFDMREDFKTEKLNGVLPLLYVFMARTHQRIQSVDYVGISKSGAVHLLPDNNYVDSIKVYGIQIKFWNSSSKQMCELTYIAQDMANWSFKETNGLYRYLQNTDWSETITYLKSASYLMHTSPFSNIRQMVLEKTPMLLQDDTGIAYRFFDKNLWDVYLYGGYAKPIPPFTGLFEKDLDSAYGDTVNLPRPLPFMVGYQWGKKGKTSILCAVRK